MVLQAGEDVGEPGLRIDVVDPGGVDQGVDCGSAAATFIRTGEGPVMATDRICRSAALLDMHSRPSSRKRIVCSLICKSMSKLYADRRALARSFVGSMIVVSACARDINLYPGSSMTACHDPACTT
jgi:hypothetical protein